jgi:hypothetical protein
MGERKGERYGGEIGRTPLNFARQAASPPPLLLSFSPYTIHLVVLLYFCRKQKGGGGYLTRTTGKRDTGCLASQLKGVW